MGKKKRIKNQTVFGCVEGNREQAFIDFLREIYAPDENNIAFKPEHSSGGTPDKIVTTAIRECHRDKSFAWFDEDFEPTESPLSSEVRQHLMKCWNVKDDAQAKGLLTCPIGKLQATYNPANNKKPTLIVSQPVCSESLILRALGQPIPYEAYDPNQRKSQIDGLKNKLNQLMGGQKSTAEQTAYYRANLTKEALEERRKSIPELDLLISMLTK